MLLRYVGEDEILKEMLGDAPRQVSVCALNDRFLLNVGIGYGSKASTTLHLLTGASVIFLRIGRK